MTSTLTANAAPGFQPVSPAHGLPSYCESRFSVVRWKTRPVSVGDVTIGGDNPIRVQSMTTTNTEDVPATVQQCIELAEAGCEIVRITAPTPRAARCLADIRRQFRSAGFSTPLVADIHFSPKAAMEAVKHVEKVRINPGNYADNKKFAVLEYSDADYERELQRLYETFSPIVLECRKLGKAMRIGTNHGSLSDRIMNRFGDSPEGMVQSALEFIRIAESHGFHDIVLSMKASNPKVMIAAYRLAVSRMKEAGMNYPLHLGVTEAGDGEDGRIKSTIGIGALLLDGLGDTIRVSLTEDPVMEIPVAQEIVRRVEKLSRAGSQAAAPVVAEETDPFTYQRRAAAEISLAKNWRVGGLNVPGVVVPVAADLSDPQAIIREVCKIQMRSKDAPMEGVLLRMSSPAEWPALVEVATALDSVVPLIAVEVAHQFSWAEVDLEGLPSGPGWLWVLPAATAGSNLQLLQCRGFSIALNLARPEDVAPARELAELFAGTIILALQPRPAHGCSALGVARQILAAADFPGSPAVWLRSTSENAILPASHTSEHLLEASYFLGPLLCEGVGDMVSVETPQDTALCHRLAYNILQGARARASKTEYVACPSCGRTLFDLQSTTQRIRERTGHLKGVTIAVMGCIVNGPGEMADADFGYVGGAPGKVNLYVGKECVQVGIPTAEAVDRLIDLIKSHNRWIEP